MRAATYTVSGKNTQNSFTTLTNLNQHRPTLQTVDKLLWSGENRENKVDSLQ